MKRPESLRIRAREFGSTLAESAWFAYAAILALELKRVWGIWNVRDLSHGDSSYYFMAGRGWYEHFVPDLAFSPLYTAFYGSLLFLSSDAYVVTILHRILILLALSALILAVMRRLLPASIAWLVAAWWVVLPINYDAYYEVHLFGLIPPLGATLLLLRADTPLARGAGVGVLLAATPLVRNELSIGVALLAGAALAYDLRTSARARGRSLRSIAAGYGVPLLLAASIILFFYVRAGVPLAALRNALYLKQAVSMCQIYAFSYKQRHSDWQKSEWTECQDLMMRDFGTPLPTQIDAALANPRAMLGHVGWNARLIPSALEVLLWNATSDSVNPDYISVLTRSRRALAASLIWLAMVIAGGFALARNRRFWWEYWIAARAWGWIGLFCVACTTFAVMIVQRPRPGYMYPLGTLLMAGTGMALHVLTHRRAIGRRLAGTAPLWMLAAIAVVPTYVPYYTDARRPLLAGYRRLAPLAARLEGASSVLVTGGWAIPLCNYFSRGPGTACQGIDFRGAGLRDVLARTDATLVYIDEDLWSDPAAAALAKTARAFGWQEAEPHGDRWIVLERMRVGSGNDEYGAWSLLERPAKSG